MKTLIKSVLTSTALAGVLAVSAVAVNAPAIGLSSEAAAQDKKKSRSQVIRNEKLGKAMNAAYEKYSEDDINGAFQALTRAPAPGELSSYERSKLYQFRGSLNAQLERYDGAVKDWEAMLREPEVSEADADSTRFNLAQIYMVQGKFKQALGILEDWRKTAEIVRASQEFLFCQAYLQTENYKKALTPCNATLTKADQEGIEKRESWVVANVVAYQQNNQYEPATNWLKWLLVNHPKEQYWKQLSGMFSQRGMEKDEVAAYEVAYLQGFLTSESDVKRMAQLYQYHGVPIKAVEVMDKGFKDGVLKRDKKTLELYGGSLQLAREAEEAKQPLADAAAKAESKDAGKLWERVAQLYIAGEDWSKAADALAKAQRAGGLSNPFRVKIYEGMSLTYSGNYDTATRAFNQARRMADKESERKQIAGWLAFVEAEKRRAEDRKKYGLKPYRSR